MPLDLVPDFLPVVGQLGDAIIAALSFDPPCERFLRRSFKSAGRGPESSLGVILRLAGRTA